MKTTIDLNNALLLEDFLREKLVKQPKCLQKKYALDTVIE